MNDSLLLLFCVTILLASLVIEFIAIYKLFKLSKENTDLYTRISTLEITNKKNRADILTLQNKILEQENRLDMIEFDARKANNG